MKQTIPNMIGILADDLTSAADGAAPFVERGFKAWIGRREKPACDIPETASVIAIDSGSRSLNADLAAQQVDRLTHQLKHCRYLYKTVDSTLRGHVRAELETAFAASGRKRLVFAPAFPDAGRVTIGGVQYVDGIPVAESLYGRDPVHPAHTSSLAELVPSSITDIMILNAETQGELDLQIARIPSPESILWVGSPGLAQALARRFCKEISNIGEIDGKIDIVRGDCLIAIGSANPLSHRQADRLEGMPGVSVLRNPDERQANSEVLLSQLADKAIEHLESKPVRLLIATGGDTMEAILDRLTIRSFELLGEFEPGFPLGRCRRSTGQPLLIAMKAGGFGDEHSLHRALTQTGQAPQRTKVMP